MKQVIFCLPDGTVLSSVKSTSVELIVPPAGQQCFEVPLDVDVRGKKRLANGTLANAVETAAPPIDKATEARYQRTNLLTQSDWTQLADSPLTAAAAAQWRAYRQALRDVPLQPGFPDLITWPATPSA